MKFEKQGSLLTNHIKVELQIVSLALLIGAVLGSSL